MSYYIPACLLEILWYNEELNELRSTTWSSLSNSFRISVRNNNREIYTTRLRHGIAEEIMPKNGYELIGIVNPPINRGTIYTHINGIQFTVPAVETTERTSVWN